MSVTNPPKSSSGEAELPSIQQNEINGIDCPACGHPTLMLGNGGYITCALADCPNPDFADAVHSHSTNRAIEAVEGLLIGSLDYDDFVRRATDKLATLKDKS